MVTTVLHKHVDEFTSALLAPELENTWFDKALETSSKISPQLALEIYKNNTNGARVNALQVIYPVCEKILGVEVFTAIANEYVRTDFSSASDLNEYGGSFNVHLNALLEANRLSVEYNYLADLSKLEYQVHTAYYANDDPNFNFSLFETRMQNNEQIYFRLSESLALISSSSPIHEIWLSNSNVSSFSPKNIQAIAEIQYLLIHRGESMPIIVEIEQCEYQLLNAFMSNHSLQSVIKSSQCDIDNILPKLVANRWISDVI